MRAGLLNKYFSQQVLHVLGRHRHLLDRHTTARSNVGSHVDLAERATKPCRTLAIESGQVLREREPQLGRQIGR